MRTFLGSPLMSVLNVPTQYLSSMRAYLVSAIAAFGSCAYLVFATVSRISLSETQGPRVIRRRCSLGVRRRRSLA